MIFWPGGFRSRITGRSGARCRPRPGSHSSADTQARWVRNGVKRTPGYEDEIQRRCPPGRGLNKERFIDKVHTGTCEPGQEPRI
ncbi:MAG: hypothetical protein GDA36_07960 [Rhodobacteraceae bacterium]|nr:hypothetical protein [Paracoccaceae bacterium]